MSKNTSTAEKILAHIKSLRNHLQPDEQPLLALPAIWDAGQDTKSTPCDLILTDQRLFGYYAVNFPRERLFLDALDLTQIRSVSVRKKNFEPLFRELLVSDEQRKISIRAPRQKIETLYTQLRSAIETYVQTPQTTYDEDTLADKPSALPTLPAPIYGRQEIKTAFASSNVAIMLLFMGGLGLEIGGAALWQTVGQAIGLPLCLAGFVLVFAASAQRRQRR